MSDVLAMSMVMVVTEFVVEIVRAEIEKKKVRKKITNLESIL